MLTGNDDRRWISVAEAAQRSGYHQNYIRRLARRRSKVVHRIAPVPNAPASDFSSS